MPYWLLLKPFQFVHNYFIGPQEVGDSLECFLSFALGVTRQQTNEYQIVHCWYICWKTLEGIHRHRGSVWSKVSVLMMLRGGDVEEAGARHG